MKINDNGTWKNLLEQKHVPLKLWSIQSFGSQLRIVIAKGGEQGNSAGKMPEDNEVIL